MERMRVKGKKQKQKERDGKEAKYINERKAGYGMI